MIVIYIDNVEIIIKWAAENARTGNAGLKMLHPTIVVDYSFLFCASVTVNDVV